MLASIEAFFLGGGRAIDLWLIAFAALVENVSSVPSMQSVQCSALEARRMSSLLGGRVRGGCELLI